MMRKWCLVFVKDGPSLSRVKTRLPVVSVRRKRSLSLPALEVLEDRTVLSPLSGSLDSTFDQVRNNNFSLIQDTRGGNSQGSSSAFLGGSTGGQNSNGGPGYPTTGPLASVNGSLLPSGPPTAVFLPPSTQGTHGCGFQLLFPALLNAVPGVPAAQTPAISLLGISNVLSSTSTPAGGTSITLPVSNVQVPQVQPLSAAANPGAATPLDPATVQGISQNGSMNAGQQAPGTLAAFTDGGLHRDAGPAVAEGSKAPLVMNISAQANTTSQFQQDVIATPTQATPGASHDVSDASSSSVKSEETPIEPAPAFGTVASTLDGQLLESITATVDPSLAQSVTDGSNAHQVSSTDAVWTTRRVSLSLAPLAPLGLLAGYLFVSRKVPHQEKQNKLQLPKPKSV